jgi:hypothetical protein
MLHEVDHLDLVTTSRMFFAHLFQVGEGVRERGVWPATYRRKRPLIGSPDEPSSPAPGLFRPRGPLVAAVFLFHGFLF